MSDNQVLVALERIEVLVADLRGGQSDLHEEFRDEIRQVRTDFRSELGATRVSILERLSQVQADAAVAFGRADAALRYGEHTREELRDVSKLITPIIRRIQSNEDRMDRLKGRLDGWSTPRP